MPLAHSPHAPVSISHPVPWRCCDRCGARWSYPKTGWQFDWRGASLANLRLIVCPRCDDLPQPNGRKPVWLSPEPRPVRDPRPGFAATQMQGSVPTPNTPTRPEQLHPFTLNYDELDDPYAVLG